MAARRIRVLVVDDSAVIRQMICDFIAETGDMEVAGVASSGAKAIELCDALRPDVITLDIQMPEMDGLTALDAILAKRPVPVILVSSLTQRGAGVTLDALDRGAMEYVAKPERKAEAEAVLREELLRKIRSIAGADVRRVLQIRKERKQRRRQEPCPVHVPKEAAPAGTAELADKCIALGISTGGPPALAGLFETLRPPMPPIVVVQHMPPHFTKPLAWRLDSLSALSIQEAADGDILQPNHAYLAPGGRHLELLRRGNRVKVVLREGEPVSGHKPSADVMMTAAAKAFGPNCLGVIMTGMGRDGANGCRAIRAAGGFVLGQDEATSDVYGMNKVALVEGSVDRQFALGEAAAVITRQVRRLGTAGPAVDTP